MLKFIVKFQTLMADIKEKTDGATIVEYSTLIGLLTVALIILLAAISTWMNGAWAALCGAVNLPLTPCVVPGP